MNDHKPLLWAQGENANVKEPIEALREHGWRYGDVPAASNFNWLFKMLTEEIAKLKKDLATQKEELTEALAQQAQRQDEKLGSKAQELRGEITNSTRSLRTNIADLARTQRSDDKQLATSLEVTWDTLRAFAQMLRHYHPDLPVTPWPSKVWPDNLIETSSESIG